VRERRQVKPARVDEIIGFTNDGIDFRTFHGHPLRDERGECSIFDLAPILNL
jgi:hypothetical protein